MKTTGERFTRKALGKIGEDYAAAWLKKKGVRVLERNFRCPIGEIDIIGEADDIIVIIEVRGRSSDRWGTPAESVDTRKKRKLRQVAMYYLCRSGQTDKACRFDVLSLLYDPSGYPARVEWITDAF